MAPLGLKPIWRRDYVSKHPTVFNHNGETHNLDRGTRAERREREGTTTPISHEPEELVDLLRSLFGDPGKVA
ncbi:MAG: hypothetical protein DMG60_20910 [Acidobacteria bacterium]|nr:MAG: hypothetical protein DMG60_20910 [Acidobacteriota bacterium]